MQLLLRVCCDVELQPLTVTTDNLYAFFLHKQQHKTVPDFSFFINFVYILRFPYVSSAALVENSTVYSTPHLDNETPHGMITTTVLNNQADAVVLYGHWLMKG